MNTPLQFQSSRRARISRWATLFTLCAITSARLAHAAIDTVTMPVDDTKRTTLSDRRAAWATPQNERGAVAADLALGHLTLSLKRTPDRQAAFEALLREQQDPASPNYQKWLSADEFGERFGASQNDIDAISNWMRVQGLNVDEVAASRTRIRFSGRAADVARAFDVGLAWFDAGDRTRIASKSSARIPLAFANAISGVVGLDSFVFEPSHELSKPRSASLAKDAPHPAGTTCDANGCDHVMFPADFARIYNADAASLNATTGSGQTIAIVGRARVYAPDIQNFRSLAGLPANTTQITVPPGAVDPGDPASACSDTGTPSCTDPGDAVNDQAEATLDVQLAGSAAPGAAIKLVVAKDTATTSGLQQAIEYVIDTTAAHVLSISFLSCEANNSSALAHYLDDLFGQAAAQGISIFVASGDAGAAGCADHTGAPPANQTRGINVICSSGNVTCVGGTQFADTVDPSLYWNTTNAAGYLSARGYIPEGAWNEPLKSTGESKLGGTGGGTSIYIAKPSWQTGTGVPTSAFRHTPDVSLNAASHDGYFSCLAAQQGSCAVVGGSFHFLISSGTSASAPGMAGIAARIAQNAGGAQGNLNPRLYALAATPSNGVFHDVTPASSGVSPCNIAVPSPCNNSTAGPTGLSGGLQGYAVTTGYDLATGLGSVDVAKLVSAWGGSHAGIKRNQNGLSGSWANAATQSQGLVMNVQRDFYSAGNGFLFAGWFTYDTSAAGGQRWYTIQSEVNDNTDAMPIYLTQGGRLDSSQATTTAQVGTATLNFADCTHGTLNYSFNDGSGRNGSIPLTRLLTNVTCSPTGDVGNPNANYWISGTWADPSNSGQGLVMDVDPTQHLLFAAWYTFKSDATAASGPFGQHWFTLQAPLTAGATQTSTVTLYDSSGGIFDHAATTTTTAVGTASIVLHGCSSATLSYQFTSGANAGRSGTLDLVRLGNPPSGCNL